MSFVRLVIVGLLAFCAGITVTLLLLGGVWDCREDTARRCPWATDTFWAESILACGEALHHCEHSLGSAWVRALFTPGEALLG